MSKKIIVVLGMHRSGTSAIAKGIVELGAHPGNNLLPANEENPKGYWEDVNIVNLNEKILKNFNMRWHSLDNPMINRFETLLPLYEEKYLEEALEIINNNFKSSNTILIKDPRISILLPFWQKVFKIANAEVKYVLAVRNPLETSKSLLKRNKMDIDKGIKLWSYYNFMALKNIKSNLLVCNFSSLLNNPIQELDRISSHIEVGKSNSDVEEYCNNFLENSLKHYNEDIDKLTEYLGENHVSVTIFNKLYEWSKENIISANEINNFSCRYLEDLTQSLGCVSNESIYDDYAQVFINDGNGYSEENSYKYNLNTTTNSVDINVEKNSLVKELRFDPSNYSCILIINDIKLEKNGELIDYESLNGNFQYKFNNLYIFENEDPQIIIKPYYSNFTKIIINFSIFSIDAYTHTLLSYIKDQKNNKLNSILNIKDQEISKKNEEIRAKDKIIEDREQELKERNEELRVKNQILEEKNREIDKNRKEIRAKDKIIEDREQELKERNGELRVKDQILEEKNREIDKNRKEIRAKDKIIEDREQEINKKNEELKIKEQVIQEKNQEILSLKELLSVTENEISTFLELMNERKRLKYRRFFQYILRVIKNFIKILVYPRKRIKLLYNKRILKKSRTFDEYYYLLKNKDLILADIDPLEHFIDVGWKEGRSPNPGFNMELHLQQHPSCLVENRNPLITMIKDGQKVYKTLKKSKLFDHNYYYSNYSDVAEQKLDPVKHYIEYGFKEGRNPSEYFDTNFYLTTYEDVKNVGINPLYHYIVYGQYEGRLPHGSNKIKYNVLEKYIFNFKKLLHYKNQNNINALKIIKFIKNRGIKDLIINIRSVITGESVVLNKKYTYVPSVLDEEIKEELSNFKIRPKISIIMPVYNVDPKWLDLAIKSIKNQWYKNWELCIVDDCSTNKKTINYLNKLNDSKIKVKFLKQNLNISGASNEALKMATGEYIALMDNDDEITDNALYEVVKVINQTGAEFIYSDEDKIDMKGNLCEPHFKPDYSPDMFLSQNYISHLGVIKKSLIEKVGGFTVGLEGAQDYDLYLKVLEHTDEIEHIPKVLYHWRKIPGSTASEFSEKSYAQEAGRLALENAMKRRKRKATVLNGKFPGTYRVKYKIDKNPLVSIIIPFKDKPELLKICIESILTKSTYKNFEIIGISNNSSNLETFKEMDRLTSMDSRVQFKEYNIPFNYSKINNYAVEKFAKGEHIILLNNDIEIISEDWIESMLEFSQRKDVGAVGAKLYYPNNTIQHAGVIIGLGGVAGHSHKHFSKDDPGYFFRSHIIQNLSGVTAACLMVKKSLYEEVNGLDEVNLKVAFNDVDFCLRLRERGYVNVYNPYVEAYHHESISRGYEDNPEKIKRFQSEIDYMKKRHKQILEKGDPYYNVNLTLDYENFSLK